VGFADIRAITRIGVALLGMAAVASAHEIGTTQVHALFHKDHTYSIDVITAPQSLLNKLEICAHRARSGMLPAAEQRARLQSFTSMLASVSNIQFDEVQGVPRVDVLPIATPADPQQPAFVVVRFRGDIPQKATTFTWQYDLAYSAYALALENEGHGDIARQWLDGDQRSARFSLARDVVPPTRLHVVRQYLSLGFTHIVPYGLDHILFVLGIFLLSTKVKRVLTQVTAFTIAHSITLGLTIYGVVSVSPRIVEPAIALSIAYVAIENLTTSQLRSWRVAIVFAFGLLHGMGFAGVLKDLSLPRSEFLTALITFNIGVEGGQLAVIAAAWLLVVCWAQARPWYRYRFVMPSSAIIAATGIFWTVQRLVA